MAMNASTMSAPSESQTICEDDDISPGSVLDSTRAGEFSKIVAERKRLLSEQVEDDHHDHHHHHHNHDHGHHHDHDHDKEPKVPNYAEKRKEAMATNRKAMKKLIIVLLTSLVFIVVEILGGYYADSIAIMSDAAHIASDVIGFGISICALHIAHRNANSTYTFGYHRVEILGAFCSIFTIWIMTAWLIYEATQRFFKEPEI